MNFASMWPWMALLLLGALHGLNPGMGWLFAVGLGVQRGERRAVWLALLPLTLGHALAIAVAVLLAGVIGLIIPLDHLPWMIASALIALGVRQLVRHRHPRWGGMRVSGRDLVIWSFLVASAHGAGLMSVPFAAGAGAVTSPSLAFADAASHDGSASDQDDHAGTRPGALPHRHGEGVRRVSGAIVVATLVHTAGYVFMTAVLALVVYHFAGLRLLRRAWFNVDAIWAAVLMLTGVALIFM